jgi:hypothetical protein
MLGNLGRTSLDHEGTHLAQFYGADPGVLVENVAAFIDEGLERGEPALVIATPGHTDAILSALRTSRPRRDRRSRKLVFLDAQATLDQFMCDGRPDWRRFEQVVGGTIRGLRHMKPRAALRAYGEMVGLLWAAGQVDAAVQLENFWNLLLSQDEFKLFCGYPVDVFADEFNVARVHDLLCAHTQVLPGGNISVMESALGRAITDVLGQKVDEVSHAVDSEIDPLWGDISSAEATILWLKKYRTAYASEILSRARAYYRAAV